MWLTTGDNFSGWELPPELNLRSTQSLKCYKGMEDPRPASSDFTSLVGSTALPVPVGSSSVDGQTACVVRQVLVGDGHV